MGGWLDNYKSDDDDPYYDDDEALSSDSGEAGEQLNIPNIKKSIPSSISKNKVPGTILACTHCGSLKIQMRSSSNDSEKVRFHCKKCKRFCTHDCPHGYQRVYYRPPL